MTPTLLNTGGGATAGALDDALHAEPARQTRDDDVGTILQAAGLPLIHVLPDWTYNTRELEAAPAPYLSAKRGGWPIYTVNRKGDLDFFRFKTELLTNISSWQS